MNKCLLSAGDLPSQAHGIIILPTDGEAGAWRKEVNVRSREGEAPTPFPEHLLLASTCPGGRHSPGSSPEWLLLPVSQWPQPHWIGQLTQAAQFSSKGRGVCAPLCTVGLAGPPHPDLTPVRVPSMVLGLRRVNPSCVALRTGLNLIRSLC